MRIWVLARAVYRALYGAGLAASVVCWRLPIHPDGFLASMEGSRAAATAPSHSDDRIGVRKRRQPDGPRGLLTRAELGGVSVERVQRKSGGVWRVRWRENGHPHQLAMLPATASDERWRNAMCHQTRR